MTNARIAAAALLLGLLQGPRAAAASGLRALQGNSTEEDWYESEFNSTSGNGTEVDDYYTSTYTTAYTTAYTATYTSTYTSDEDTVAGAGDGYSEDDGPMPGAWMMLKVAEDDALCMTLVADNELVMDACTGEENQLFRKAEDGTMRSMAKPDLCMDYHKRRNNIYFHTCHLKENQIWTINEDDGTVTTDLNDDTCMDMSLEAPHDLSMSSCVEVPSQSFYWEYIPVGYRVLKLANLWPDRCLTVDNYLLALAPCVFSGNQLFPANVGQGALAPKSSPAMCATHSEEAMGVMPCANSPLQAFDLVAGEIHSAAGGQDMCMEVDATDYHVFMTLDCTGDSTQMFQWLELQLVA